MPDAKISFSNTLVLISMLFTMLALSFTDLYRFWMNDLFLNSWAYHMFWVQIFSSQFIHGNFTHLLFNSIFVFYFGNILESIIGYKKMIIFFIVCSIFLAIVLIAFWSGNTVWMSWFLMALLTYYTLLLKQNNNPEYTAGITVIVVNVLYWLLPWISFLGHFWWMVFWWLFWFIAWKKK